MEGKTIGIIAIVIIIIGGGWYLLSRAPADTSSNTTGQTPGTAGTASTTTTTTTTTTSGVTIAYTDQGFSPKSVTVPLGTTVTFVNQTSGPMQVASALHPTHVVYDNTTRSAHCAVGYAGPLPFDQCTSGAGYSFIFTKAGTHGYHDHVDASHFGNVIVTATTTP